MNLNNKLTQPSNQALSYYKKDKVRYTIKHQFKKSKYNKVITTKSIYKILDLKTKDSTVRNVVQEIKKQNNKFLSIRRAVFDKKNKIFKYSHAYLIVSNKEFTNSEFFSKQVKFDRAGNPYIKVVEGKHEAYIIANLNELGSKFKYKLPKNRKLTKLAGKNYMDGVAKIVVNKKTNYDVHDKNRELLSNLISKDISYRCNLLRTTVNLKIIPLFQTQQIAFLKESSFLGTNLSQDAIKALKIIKYDAHIWSFSMNLRKSLFNEERNLNFEDGDRCIEWMKRKKNYRFTIGMGELLKHKDAIITMVTFAMEEIMNREYQPNRIQVWREKEVINKRLPFFVDNVDQITNFKELKTIASGHFLIFHTCIAPLLREYCTLKEIKILLKKYQPKMYFDGIPLILNFITEELKLCRGTKTKEITAKFYTLVKHEVRECAEDYTAYSNFIKYDEVSDKEKEKILDTLRKSNSECKILRKEREFKDKNNYDHVKNPVLRAKILAQIGKKLPF